MIVRSLCYVLIFFLIVSCNQKDDRGIEKCGKIACLNGATCVDDTCLCPTGFSGLACETLETPISIVVRTVILTNFPEKDSNNESWDTNGLPDIFFQIYKELDAVPIYTEVKTHENAVHTENYSFTPNQLTITEVNTPHRILLLDFDFSKHDILGELTFTPFDGKSLPKEIILGAEEEVTLRLMVDYNF